jgi:hypothetical protein
MATAPDNTKKGGGTEPVVVDKLQSLEKILASDRYSPFDILPPVHS